MKIDNAKYVRIYSAVLYNTGIFGETSPEITGIFRAVGTTGTTATKDLVVKRGTRPTVETSNMGTSEDTVNPGTYTYNIFTDAENVFVNETAVTCSSTSAYAQTVTVAAGETKYIRIITQSGTAAPYITVLKITGKTA